MSGENEKFSLLLVEDDLPLAAVMEEYLGRHGFAVIVEHRGDRAVERILTSRPDLVLLDIMLPGGPTGVPGTGADADGQR